MMKKLYTLTLATCALVNLCSAGVDTDKLEEAIEQSELSRVKSLFKKIEREEMTPIARKKLFGGLYDSAAEVTERRSSSISLFGNWRDTAKIGVGAALGVVGTLGILLGIRFKKANQDESLEEGYDDSLIESWPFVGGGAGILLGSAYLLYKGITCGVQKSGVAQAKLVEKFIKAKLSSDDEAEVTK